MTGVERARAVGIALAMSASWVGPVQAQVIRGVVIDETTSRPVPDVALTLLGEERPVEKRTLSDSSGVFWFEAELGVYRLRAERIGYGVTRTLPFRVLALDTVRVELRISAQALMLAPLSVEVVGVPGRELFEERVAAGEGFHFTPEMVDSLRPSEYVGEIFRSAEKTWVRWGFGRGEDGKAGPLPGVFTYLGSGCLHYVVDRTLVPKPFFGSSFWGVPPLSELTPDDLVAIEVYRAWHEIPEDLVKQLRFRTPWERDMLRIVNRKECGMVVIWTEDGW